MYRLFFLLIICPGLYAQDLGKILWGESPLSSPLNFDFISSKFNDLNTKSFSGTYSINVFPEGIGFEVLKDEQTFKNRKNDELFKQFPEFSIEISIEGKNVLIRNKNIIQTNNNYWDLSFSDGSSWYEDKLLFISAPFSLIQKNANCVHNGVLIFSINNKYEISKSIFQISSETCAYFQFNYIAIFNSFFSIDTNINFDERKKTAYEQTSFEGIY